MATYKEELRKLRINNVLIWFFMFVIFTAWSSSFFLLGILVRALSLGLVMLVVYGFQKNNLQAKYNIDD